MLDETAVTNVTDELAVATVTVEIMDPWLRWMAVMVVTDEMAVTLSCELGKVFQLQSPCYCCLH